MRGNTGQLAASGGATTVHFSVSALPKRIYILYDDSE